MISTEQRDNDIRTLAEVNGALSPLRNMSFLVTGSYAIEALTHAPVDHGDMDANVFAPDLPQARAATLELLNTAHDLRPYKQTSDRLEYDIQPSTQSVDPRRLEIHLVQAQADLVQPNTYVLANPNSRKIFQISLVDAWLKDSKGRDHFFKVKSLAYSLATWAIRISGLAQNQLRPVRDSDLELFKLLLSQTFTLAEVNSAIEHHPQTPENIRPEKIFQTAKDILKSKS